MIICIRLPSYNRIEG